MNKLPEGIYLELGISLRGRALEDQCPKCKESSFRPSFYGFQCSKCQYTLTVCIDCGNSTPSLRYYRCATCRPKRIGKVRNWWRGNNHERLQIKERIRHAEEREIQREQAIAKLKQTYKDLFD